MDGILKYLNNILISIVVCTYNRSALLSVCLYSLVRQDAEKGLYEIVIIDNKSTDDTSVVAQRFVNNNKNIRLIFEEKQGLGNARNRGFIEALGKYIAYIDDDALAHKDWVSKMYNFILRHPEVKAFGGPYFPYSLMEIPEWMPSEFGKNSLGEKERPIRFGNEWITGTNMVFSKNIFSEIGGFRDDIGMNALKISYGEEIEFLRRIGSSGQIVYYVPSMKVDHLVANYKMNVIWLLKSYYAKGRSKARRHNTLLPFYRVLVRFIIRITIIPMIIISNQDKCIKGRMIDALLPVASGFGMVIERIMIGFGFEHIERNQKAY